MTLARVTRFWEEDKSFFLAVVGDEARRTEPREEAA
jgi:hypothetical protein